MADDNMTMGYLMGQSEGNNGGFGNFGEGIWAVIILAILFGRGGLGGFGGFGGGGEAACATQADLAAGFNNSAVLNNLNDLKLGQAGIQQTLCQGFNGVNTTVLQGFNGVDNAICTLGYQNQTGFNNLSRQMSDCCCTIERQIERGFCDTNANIAAQTRSILDFLTTEKIDSLRAENQALRFQASQAAQNQYLVDQIRPCPVPAFITCNPYASVYGSGGNGGCGCGC